MKAPLLASIVLALAIAGCATSSAYDGPVSDRPLLAVSYLRHFEHDDPRLPPRLETIATADVTNPSFGEMYVVLDCSQSWHALTIKPRTTEHVLLDPQDTACRAIAQ